MLLSHEDPLLFFFLIWSFRFLHKNITWPSLVRHIQGLSSFPELKFLFQRRSIWFREEGFKARGEIC